MRERGVGGLPQTRTEVTDTDTNSASPSHPGIRTVPDGVSLLFSEISPEEVASNEESDCRGADRTPGKVTVEDFLGGEGDKEETSRNTQGRGQALS